MILLTGGVTILVYVGLGLGLLVRAVVRWFARMWRR
jgi:hypothetical protein